jgi:hypothetical protein
VLQEFICARRVLSIIGERCSDYHNYTTSTKVNNTIHNKATELIFESHNDIVNDHHHHYLATSSRSCFYDIEYRYANTSKRPRELWQYFEPTTLTRIDQLKFRRS